MRALLKIMQNVCWWGVRIVLRSKERTIQIAIVMTLCIAFASLPSPPHAGPEKRAYAKSPENPQVQLRREYDPAKCKTNTGNFVYESVGDTVFKFPAGPIPTLYNPSFLNWLRQPPDPAEQAGCLNNPFQQSSLDAFYTKYIQVRIYWNWRSAAQYTQGKALWWGELTNIDMLAIACKKASITEFISNGMKACRIKPIAPDDAEIEDWAAYYVADPKTYGTPLGQPFIVGCGPAMRSTRMDDCKVTYSYKLDMGIRYSFSPYRGPYSLTVNDVIGEDRQLRETIEAATVKDFKWPTPAKIPDVHQP